MKFGVTVPNYRRLASPKNLVMVAHRSEELGFDSLWVTDHVVVPEPYREMFGDTVYDPLSVLAFLAGQTQRLELGTAVLVIPYRNPLVVAKQLATIDTLSGGRVVFGIGSGWAREEFEALGVAYAERGPMTDEYLRAIVCLWTSDTPHFEGNYVSFHDIHAGPRPSRQPRPPILVGGYSKKAIRRAVAIGDGWLPDGLNLVELERGIGFLHQTAREAGRDPSSLQVYLRTGLWLEGVGGANTLGKQPAPWEQSADFTAPVERPAFQGTVDQVCDDIRAAARIGVDHLIFESPVQRGDERFDMIEHFARDVMPAFT